MKATAGFVASDDGTLLYRYVWTPTTEPKAVVHIAHGLGDHAGRYERVAQELVARRYVVYGHDHRGHGLTAGTRENLGWFAARDGWNRAVRDLTFLLEMERRTHAGLPLVLLGHSMGSFMAQQVMYQNGEMLAGCALSGSAGKPRPRAAVLRLLAQAERLRIGPRGRSRLLHRLSLDTANKAFEPRRTDFDWLSRDAREVDRYCADPYCGFVGTVQLWIDLLHGVFEISRPANQARVPKALPVYIFAGTGDPVSRGCRDLEQLISAYRRAGLTGVRWTFYPEGRHEMFSEINRTEVVLDLAGWLDSVVRKTRPPGPSGGNRAATP